MKESKIIYITGVSGCGKSTIGKLLSEKTGIPFYDGDDFHPSENIQKMKSGIPLNDSDRAGWLKVINSIAQEKSVKKGGIFACSALKSKYRETLEHGLIQKAIFVFLKGDYQTISKRIKERSGHFMPAHLLKSQFDDLEEPTNAVIINIDQDTGMIIDQIMEAIFS